MYKCQTCKKRIYRAEYKQFKKELIKFLKIVNRLDLKLKQDDIRKYYDSVYLTEPNVLDCYNKLIELYPLKTIHNKHRCNIYVYQHISQNECGYIDINLNDGYEIVKFKDIKKGSLIDYVNLSPNFESVCEKVLYKGKIMWIKNIN